MLDGRLRPSRRPGSIKNRNIEESAPELMKRRGPAPGDFRGARILLLILNFETLKLALLTYF
jgi:hypothetical protein